MTENTNKKERGVSIVQINCHIQYIVVEATKCAAPGTPNKNERGKRFEKILVLNLGSMFTWM